MDLVVLHVATSGRHTGAVVSCRPGTADVEGAMPPAGQKFGVTQTHWFRTRDGMAAGHWANRDHLAMARQTGWVPPSPAFLLCAATARRQAHKLSPARA